MQTCRSLRVPFTEVPLGACGNSKAVLFSSRFIQPHPAAKFTAAQAAAADGLMKFTRFCILQCGVGSDYAVTAPPDLVLSARHKTSLQTQVTAQSPSQSLVKRGRPRKHQPSVMKTTADAEVPITSASKPHVKRGRPPKARDESMLTRATTAGQDVLPQTSSSNSGSSNRPDGKRGRPSKVQDYSVSRQPAMAGADVLQSSSSSSSSSRSQGRRGRPPSPKDESVSRDSAMVGTHMLLDSSSSSSSSRSQGRRGRPPRLKDEMASTKTTRAGIGVVHNSSSNDSNGSSNRPQGKRGRPPRLKDESASTQARASAAHVLQNSSISSCSSSRPQRKTGRPPRFEHASLSKEATMAGIDVVLQNSNSSSNQVIPRHRRRARTSAVVNIMHELSHTGHLQQRQQPVQSMHSIPVAAAATTPLSPSVSEQEQLEVGHVKPQQRQQADSAQAPCSDPSAHSSSRSLHHTSQSEVSQEMSGFSAADYVAVPQPSSPRLNTEQYRQAMEHLFQLPDASIDETASSLLVDSDASTRSGSGLQHVVDVGDSDSGLNVSQSQGPEPRGVARGFKVTNTVQGRGLTRQQAPDSGTATTDQQHKQQEDPSNAAVMSNSRIAEAAVGVGADSQPEGVSGELHDHLQSLNPLEPSPLEPPAHPELHDDVELHGEQLREHRQLLQQLKQGEAVCKDCLSNPVVGSLVYLSDNKMQQLLSARQLLREHPELHRWTIVHQQEFERAVNAARKAAAELLEIQQLINKLEVILAQEEQRAGSLASSRTRRTQSNGSKVSDSHVVVDRAAATDVVADAAAGQAAADQIAQQQAAQSLEMLQRLLPQFESAQAHQQQQSDDDSDPREEYQWG